MLLYFLIEKNQLKRRLCIFLQCCYLKSSYPALITKESILLFEWIILEFHVLFKVSRSLVIKNIKYIINIYIYIYYMVKKNLYISNTFTLNLPEGVSMDTHTSHITSLCGLWKNGFSNIATGFKIISWESFCSALFHRFIFQIGQSMKR